MDLFIKSILFSVLVPGSVAVAIPLFISNGMEINTHGFAIALLFLLTGIIIYCACVWGFVKFGRGTPAPIDAPIHLVINGLYRYSRNPMYIAILIIIFGWGFLFSYWVLFIYWFGVAICFQLFIVFYEEPRLQQQFGASYTEYKTLVNRWLPDYK